MERENGEKESHVQLLGFDSATGNISIDLRPCTPGTKLEPLCHSVGEACSIFLHP